MITKKNRSRENGRQVRLFRFHGSPINNAKFFCGGSCVYAVKFTSSLLYPHRARREQPRSRKGYSPF